MGILFFILFSLAALLVFIHAALDLGIVVNIVRDRRRVPPEAPLPTVTVAVAVRNEEASLPGLLASLERQTAADCSFLFVDDRSTDGTPALLEDFKRRLGGRVNVLRNEAIPSDMTGKQAALEIAVEACRSEVMLFTDGDCTVPETWVERMRERFLEPELGVLFGRVRIAEGRSFLDRFQAFEQPLIHQYNLGGAGMGLPMGCFGNNLAARSRALRDIGGFHGLGYTVTEDAAVLSAISRSGRWKAGASVLDATTIGTRGKAGWKEYLNQHTRWNAGAFFSADPATRLGYRYVTLFLIGSIALLPLTFVDWRFCIPWMAPFLGILSLGFLAGLYDGPKRALYFLRLPLYTAFFTFFYGWVTMCAIARRPFDWKGSLLHTDRHVEQVP